jgi:cytochrome P450
MVSGPKTWPLLGAIPQLRWNPLQFLSDTAKSFKGMARLRLGPKECFLLLQPEYVKQALHEHAPNYVKSSLNKMLKPVLGEGLFTSEGARWRRQRQMVQPAFHQKRLEAMQGAMEKEIDRMLARWEGWADRGAPFDLAQEMRQLTMRIVLRTIIVTRSEKDLSTVQEAVFTLIRQGNKQLFSLFPLPTWLPFPGMLRSRDAIRTLDQFVYDIIRERREAHLEEADILSILMAARDEAGEEGMSDREIRDEILTLFIAGHETTANALAWSWIALCRDPEAQERLYHEVTQRDPAEGGERARLAYPRRLFDETLRLYPPAWIFTRQAVNDDWIGGEKIPADALLLFSPWVLHRLPDYWENPDAFNPDRFMPERAASIDRYLYLPFGAGPRRCVGASFAGMETVLTLAKVAQRFRLQLAGDPDLTPQAIVTLRPPGKVRIQAFRR